MEFTSPSWAGKGFPSCIQTQSKGCRSPGSPLKQEECMSFRQRNSVSHLFQLDHVGVRQFLQTLHLPQVHRLLPRVVLPLHPLNCHLREMFKLFMLSCSPPSLQCPHVARERHCHRCRPQELVTSHIWSKMILITFDGFFASRNVLEQLMLLQL